MSLKMSKIKKIIPYIVAILAFTAVSFTQLKAQSTGGGGSGGGGNSEAYLYQIMQNTAGILTQVNNLPTYLENVGTLALSWLAPDDSTSTTTMQQNFASFSNDVVQDMNTQDSLQPALMANIFLPSGPILLPDANDYAYTSLLGAPFTKETRKNKSGQPIDNAWNYVLNASGAGLFHQTPSPAWHGGIALDRYKRYMKAILAVESFNAYILSGVYADLSNKGFFTSTQTQLISQASSSDWFKQIATEKLGLVLRQLLMFESQSYVMLTQLLQTQKQLLTAQVLNNTLLILLNQNNENTNARNASGLPITP